MLHRLTQIIQAFCSEFDRSEDGDGRREPPPLRDTKRRGDKRLKDEKVSGCVMVRKDGILTLCLVLGREHDIEAYRSRNPDTKPSHLP